MTILGYIFTLLGYISYWVGRFFKKKSIMMLTNSLSSFFYILSFLCFGSYNGVSNSVLVVLRGLCVNLKDKLNKKMYWLYSLFVIGFITNAIIFWQGFASIFATICMLINITANWFFDSQKLRLSTCIASIFYMLFLFCIGNYVGISLETTIILSNLISFFKFRKKETL